MNISSGKYLGLEVRNVRLVGQALVRFDIYYQTSSSGVYNSDGVNVYVSCGTGYKYIGKLIIPYSKNSETYWGTFNFTINNTENHFYLTPYCEDSVSPGSYPQFTVTGPSTLGYKGHLASVGIVAAGPTTCTIDVNVRNMYSEEMTYKDFDNIYRTQVLGATSSNGETQKVRYTMTGIPANTRFSNSAGTVPDGGNGSSPWAWYDGKGQTTLNYATTFSEMSMPKLSIARTGSNVIVTWTGGGTTNKPKGQATRSGRIVLMDSNRTNLTAANVDIEASGSYTFNNISNSTIIAQAEYTVNGLVDSSGNSKVYIQKGDEVTLKGIQANSYIKVSGAYRRTTDTYIKINGAYRKVAEGYIKVNGIYKKII